MQANVGTMQQQAQQFQVDLAVVPTHPLFEQLIELEADKIALEEALYNTQRGYIQTRRGGLAPTSNLIEMMIVSQHPSPLSCSCLGELALTSRLAAFPVHVCRLFEGWPMTSLT